MHPIALAIGCSHAPASTLLWHCRVQHHKGPLTIEVWPCWQSQRHWTQSKAIDQQNADCLLNIYYEIYHRDSRYLKSATKLTYWDFAKWFGFQITWSVDRKQPNDLEATFQVGLGFKIGEKMGHGNDLLLVWGPAITWTNADWPHRNKIQWNLNQNTCMMVFCKQNAFVNVLCKMLAICRGQF